MILLVLEPGKRLDVWRMQLEMTFPTTKICCAQEDQIIIDLAEQYKPELLVLDYDLPESGPFYIMRRVKSSSPSTKFVVLTSSIGQQEMAKMAGADIVHLQNVSVKQFISSIKHNYPDLMTKKNGKETLLVAGNGNDFHKNLYDCLGREGFLVKKVRDGAHTMVSIVENPIDLVILDMNLPDIEGLRVIRVLRRIKQDLPILGLCQPDENIDMAQSEKYNAKIYMQPVEVEEFVSIIKSALKKEPQSL